MRDDAGLCHSLPERSAGRGARGALLLPGWRPANAPEPRVSAPGGASEH
eukprot:SAG31_NODE_10220_length_1168_cov_1.601497_3_plen_48_part_01